MNIKEIDKRECKECNRFLSLNLFRADGDCCRYCEIGVIPPRHVTNQFKASNDSKNDIKLDSSAINSSDIKKVVEDVYKSYVYEIIIIIGCSYRWNKSRIDEDILIDWLLNRKDLSISKQDSENLLVIKSKLKEKIRETVVDVMMIKASIRTLHEAKLDRKNDLMSFIDKLLTNETNRNEAISELKEDLISDKEELGYEIPIVKLDHTNYKKDTLNDRKILLEKLALNEFVASIIDNINSRNYIIDKKDNEDNTRKNIEKILDHKIIGIDYTDYYEIIIKSFNIGYTLFGINYINGGISKGMNGIEIINLRNKSID